MIILNKESTRSILSASILVGITATLSDFVFPDTSQITETLILGLAALMGGLIGAKLFSDRKQNENSNE